ncbi:MAG TPA: FlgD immunoglobulin-like domain containing protein, partial [Methylomirabilota bacterium]|nr:FlgD immunoglobulin-like domain containing protein [Methylomirabilota bacterium]
DQGSWVRLHWTQSPLDAPAFSNLICCYEVQRRPTAAPGDPWVSVGEHPASAEPTYELIVETAADSTSGDPALYRFRVLAKAASEPAEWISNEMDGHSVDNLAPPAPASVTGSISSGIATFFWPAVNVPDLDHYSVYRGTEAVPPTDGAHRIGTTTLTGYNDSPGYFAHYVVSAVDVHGNEGGATSFVPINAAGVDDRPAPGVLTVGQPTPSPMADRMSLSLGLPRDMNVTADVVDAQGRLLRRLSDGVVAAGWFTLSWDARDAQGRQAPAGIYFILVRTPAGEHIRRLAVLP